MARVPVRVRLLVRRFWCDNLACPRTLFAEQVPGLTTMYSCTTQRLTTALTQLGFALVLQLHFAVRAFA